jgi:hypothetical protein
VQNWHKVYISLHRFVTPQITGTIHFYFSRVLKFINYLLHKALNLSDINVHIRIAAMFVITYVQKTFQINERADGSSSRLQIFHDTTRRFFTFTGNSFPWADIREDRKHQNYSSLKVSETTSATLTSPHQASDLNKTLLKRKPVVFTALLAGEIRQAFVQ